MQKPVILKRVAKKQASLPRASDYAKTFLKDWVRLSNSGRYDMVRLKVAMLLLIGADEPLGPEWKDHALSGKLANFRECHVGGDFLLMYQLDGNAIVFVRAGTHAELFE